MASTKTIKNKDGTTSYRIFVNFTQDGKLKRESRTFSKKQLAIDWAAKRKKELEYASVHGDSNSCLIKDVIQAYIDQFGSGYGRSKNYDLLRLLNYPIAELRVDKLAPKDIVAHCIERNKEAKPQTVANDVIWLRSVIKTMSALQGFQFNSAVFDTASELLRKEKLIGKSTNRKRLPTRLEMIKLTRHFKRSRSQIPMIDIMWFAYFSARRLSEITRLEWTDNNNERLTGMVRDAKHPRLKEGNHKRFKYDKSAWKIVMRQKQTSAYIFPYNSKTIGTLFERACKLLCINNLHFHDLRHAAATRLFSKGYSIEQVQQFTLHDDWKTLARYTQIQPEDIKSL
jgi:integrase